MLMSLVPMLKSSTSVAKAGFKVGEGGGVHSGVVRGERSDVSKRASAEAACKAS